jgi:hypothetical protein
VSHPELRPRGRLDVGDAGEALGCIAGLAAGHGVSSAAWLAKPAVIDLVAEAVETAAAREAAAEHPWARGIAVSEEGGRPAITMLLRARAAADPALPGSAPAADQGRGRLLHLSQVAARAVLDPQHAR